MPYDKKSDAPANLQKLDDVELTLTQINEITAIADALDPKTVDNVWAIAIATWKKGHEIKDGAWVAKEKQSDNSRRVAALHFSRKKFNDLRAVKTWVEAHGADAPESGQAIQRNGELYYASIDFDEGCAGFVVGDGIEDGVRYLYMGQVAADNPPEPELDPLYKIEGVEIFRVGKWEDSTGVETEYTADDLQRMIDLTRKDGVPFKLGHWSGDGDANVGNICNLRMDGDSLLCDITNIPLETYKGMKEGRWPKRSAEILWRGSKPELVAVALLGASQSALPLENIFKSNVANARLYSYSFADRKISKFENHERRFAMSEEEVKALKDENTALKEKIAALEAEIEKSKMSAAEHAKAEKDKAEFSRVSAELAEYKRREEDAAKQADVDDIARFSKAIETKVAPAEREDYVAFYSAKKKEERADYEKRILARPNHAALGENLKGDGGSSNDPLLSDDPHVKETAEIAKYAKENGLDLHKYGDLRIATSAVAKYEIRDMKKEVK
jgi:hypothetical protein